jgi:glycerol-1-phosphate dehydrogenase [NAD(P)+]
MNSLANTPRAATPDPIQSLLDGTYVDAESGKTVSIATRSLVVADTLAGTEAELIAGLGFGRKLAVISDPMTRSVLGARVEAALAGRFDMQSVALADNPYPDDDAVNAIRKAAVGADAYIAVGSGTINDLTKYSSALDGKPYAVFATAPSMNGYTSLTASISQHGHKLTLPAHVPAGAFFDLAVLAAAPKRMIRAGLGDSVCRATAQTDWLLSHLLLGTPYRQLPFDLLADEEPRLLDMASDLMAGSIEAMRVLVRTLILSGLGTAIFGSSAPASQAEHLVSHYIDMLAPSTRPHVFHGEQVGVTTLSMARLQETLLASPPVLEADTVTERDVIDHFGAELGSSCWPEFSAKRLDAAKAEELNHRISAQWTAISAKLAQSFLSPARIEAVLHAAGGPTTPASIHLDRGFYEAALLHGREIRNRFTVLDVMGAAGRLSSMLPTI